MTHASRLDLDTRLRAAVLPILQARLSDTLDLQAQVKQAHWNVRGPAFIALHQLFDRIAGEVALAADDIAERIVAMGGMADGRPVRTARDSSLPEWHEGLRRQETVLDALAAAISTHGQGVRVAIDLTAKLNDAGTADLFTGQSRLADKHLWMVEAHLTETSGT